MSFSASRLPCAAKTRLGLAACALALFTHFASAQKADPKLQPADLPNAGKEISPPLGLPRLKTTTKPGKANGLIREAYDVDALAIPTTVKDGSVRSIQRNGLQILEIGATHTWTSPLRKGGKDTICVSFLLYAGDTTVVAIDGAWLGIAKSPVATCLQLMIGEWSPTGVTWREAGIHIKRQVYGGEEMIALPVLTVRIDPKARIWDLYSGSTSIADGMVLGLSQKGEENAGKFVVRAGKGKTWLCGLVQTGDNPLFEDSNGNGIDDEYERTKKGGLLPAAMTPAQRSAVTTEWRDNTRIHTDAWFINKPRPD